MKVLQGISILFLLFFSITIGNAQVTPAQEQMVRQELERRGLKEEDVRRKLEERGINIDDLTPEELPALQSTLEEIAKELEAEKKANPSNTNPTSPPPDTTIEVSEKEVLEKADKLLDELDEQQISDLTKRVEGTVQEGADIDDAIAIELAEEAVGTLPPPNVYGQQLFRDKTLAVFNRSLNVIPDDSYVIGPGDKISVSIWGVSQEEATLTVNSTGYVQPSQMPRINLKGIALGKAKQLLQRRYAQFYQFRPEEFEVTISQARTLTINIYGEVLNPGGYNLPATNTAFNALMATGGPTDIGSVRKIRLIRGGEKPKWMDVYEFMLDPSVQEKYYLEDNDIIHVGVANKVVSINGAVNRAFKYELLDNENLMKLIDYAGGLKENAYHKAIQLKRFENNEEKLIDIPLKQLMDTNQDFELYNGDEISIKTIPTTLKNFVEISGAVDFPSKYELKAGDRVLDLINKGILKEDARTDVAYLVRTRTDGSVNYQKLDIGTAFENPANNANILLQSKDEVIILSQASYVDINTFSIEGAVRKPREAQFDPEENIKIEDAVLLAGGLKANARNEAYIIRTDVSNIKDKSYIKFNVRQALINPDSEDNLTLKPLDKIVIYSKEGFADETTVTVEGAVRNPGEYAYDEGLRVSDVIYFSNGLKLSATDFAIIHRPDPNNLKKKSYVRVNLKEALENPASGSNILLKPNDLLVVFNEETYTDESMVEVSGAVRKPGEFKYDETLTLRDALTLAGGLKIEAATNRVEVFRVDLKDNVPTRIVVATLKVNKDLTVEGDDFILAPFDQVFVRTVPDFEFQQVVTVRGEVRYPGPYPLISKNEKLRSVIERAGGLTEEGFPEGATLLRQNDNGYVVTKLDEVLKNPKTRTNYILKEGDIIEIPKKKDLVQIDLSNTRAAELYPNKVVGKGKLSIPHHNGKRAGFYLKEYAVGLGDSAKRSLITVEHANGEIERTKRFLFFNITPKVKEGSIVSVGAKAPKEEKEKLQEQKEETDWGKIVSNTVAQITAVLTLVVLAQQLE